MKHSAMSEIHQPNWLLRFDAGLLSCILAVLICIPYAYAKPSLTSVNSQPAGSSSEQILDQIIVIVNESIILESALKQRVNQLIQATSPSRQLPPPKVLVSQILDRMILETIQFDIAKQIGIRVNDNELNEAILGIANQNKLTFSEFQQKLKAQNIRYVDFREQVRRDMVLNQVQQRNISPRIQVTDQDANTFLSSPIGKEQLGANYRLQHILIAIDDENDEQQIQEAQIQANQIYSELSEKPTRFSALAMEYSNSPTALEGGDLGWRSVKALPTLFADLAITMKVGEISSPINSPSGYHIIRLADRRGEKQQMVKQFNVRHILIKPNEIRSNSASKRLILEIYDKLLNGEKFEQLAQTYSDDMGSARKGGALGWVSPGQMVPRFEKEMGAIHPNTYSTPFESAFGWHILEVTDSRTEDFSDEFRVAQAKNFVFRRKFEEELPIWLREIRQDAYVEQKIDIEVLARQFTNETFIPRTLQ